MPVAYLTRTAQPVHRVQVQTATQDTVEANARVLLGTGETLTTAVWETSDRSIAGLVSASVDDDSSAVILSSTLGGYADVRCQLTTSTGRKFPVWYRVESVGGPFAEGMSYGSDTLTVVNP